MSGPEVTTLRAYFRLMNLNGAAQIYHTALQTDLFSSLENEPLSTAGIAQACKLQERPLVLLLDALCALELLEQDGELFKLTDVARMLIGSDYRELGNQYWRHLPTFLQSGVPIKKMDDIAESETHYQTQAAMLGWMLRPAAEKFVEALEIGRLRENLSILDVGAGSAVWSLNIARRDPQTRVTAVDWPAVLEVARETAEDFDVAGCLTTVEGNYHEVELPDNAFDLAIAANVTHLETPEGNINLIRKLHRSLKSGGEIAIIDVFPGSSLDDVPFTLYRLGLALRTQQGQVYSQQELQAMLGDNGFSTPQLLPLEAPPHVVGLLIAQKR